MHLTCVSSNPSASSMITTTTSTTTTDASFSSKLPQMRLADDFVPNNYTVLCGRGKEFFNYIGNRRFRILVDMHLEKYSLAETKTDKTRIVCEIVDRIRSAGGSFCKQQRNDNDNGIVWYEVGDAVAREKVGALFRDCLFNMYKSSSKAKTAVRRHKRKCQGSQGQRSTSSTSKPTRATSRCRGTSSASHSSSSSSSSGSITDSTTTDASSSYDSLSSSSSTAHDEVYAYNQGCDHNAYGDEHYNGYSDDQCCHHEESPYNHVKEVRFSQLLAEQDLQPLMLYDDVDYDLDDDVADFNFVEL